MPFPHPIRAVRSALLRLRKRVLHENGTPRRIYAYYRSYRRRILLTAFVLFHLAGALSSIDAIMQTRTPQGAIAWAISLNTFPYVAVPAYWVFGHNDFEEYVEARHRLEEESLPAGGELPSLGDSHPNVATPDDPAMAVLTKLAKHPAMTGNRPELLVDGDAFMDSLCAAIAQARHYVLVQFYILRGDDTGQRLARSLRDCTDRGVRVCLLYDAYGSMQTPSSFLDGLAEGSAEVAAFRSERDGPVDFEVNYRNHRKLVVIDGETAFAGGMNIGDEYLSGSGGAPSWRDTHLKISGPVVPYLQRQFALDWFWATHTQLAQLRWDTGNAVGSATALAIATGPADELENCALMFQAAILSAKERIWISTPYLAPDDAVTSALTLAALRGVEVRILIPEKGDSFPVHQASYTYLPELARAGVKVSRYPARILHQKALLVDDDLVILGSANLDNRSFRLNFELNVAVWHDAAFIADVAAMLEDDFAKSRRTTAADMEEASFSHRLSAKFFRLLAPIH